MNMAYVWSLSIVGMWLCFSFLHVGTNKRVWHVCSCIWQM